MSLSNLLNKSSKKGETSPTRFKPLSVIWISKERLSSLLGCLSMKVFLSSISSILAKVDWSLPETSAKSF